MTVAKRFTLSDGSTWTARELSEKIGLTTTACRYRMETSLDVEEVFRDNHHPITRRRYKCKTFELSDGTVMTAVEIAQRFNVNQSTNYARLLKGERDVLELCKRPTKGKQKHSNGYVNLSQQPKAVKQTIMERNFYDPMSRLFMKMA